MSESIRAVERALDVLSCFSSQTPELSMTQIAEKIGIHKSTVHRLLATLENRRFVDRDPATGLYRAGIRLLQLAYLTLEHNDLRQLAAPFLSKLREQFLETIDLGVLDGTEIVFIDVFESPLRVKLAAAIGQRLPAFSTASGKAIFAFMPEEAVQQLLKRGISQYTDYTLQTEQAILESLRQTRALGFSLAEQEYEEGINALAAPIFSPRGNPIASTSVAGPAFRLTRERMLEIGPTLVATTQAISQELKLADPESV